MKLLAKINPTKLFVPAIIFLMICTFVLNNGVLPPNLMEARNLTTAREMVTEHNWLSPTLNGEIRLEKPPLPTWIVAGTMLIFGQDNLSLLRLPAALAAMLLIFFLIMLTRELTEDKLLPWLVAGTASTSFYIFFMARDISWDMFCHSFMLGAIWLFHKGLKSKNSYIIPFTGSAILAGLSFLSKGPVAFYALLLPYFMALFLARKQHLLVFNLKGFLIWGFVTSFTSVLWPIYIYLSHPDYSALVALKESSSWISRNVRPIYHYWSFTAQTGIWVLPAALSLVIPFVKKHQTSYGNNQLPVIWTIISFLLLSIVPEKKERYLLPALIPLAITTAYFYRNLMSQLKDGKPGKLELWFLKGYGYLILIVSFLIPVIFAILLWKSVHHPNLIPLLSAFLFFWGTGVLLLKAVKQLDPLKFWVGMVLTVASTTAIIFGSAPSIINKNLSYRPYTELRHNPQLEGLPFYYSEKRNDKLIEVVWAIGRKIDFAIDTEVKSLPDKDVFVLLSPDEPEKIYSQELLMGYEFESIGLFDANMQKRWGGDVLKNWVTLFRKKSWVK